MAMGRIGWRLLRPRRRLSHDRLSEGNRLVLRNLLRRVRHYGCRRRHEMRGLTHDHRPPHQASEARHSRRALSRQAAVSDRTEGEVTMAETPKMREYSTEAWNIASKYSHVLASETRDLAAWIDAAIAAARREGMLEAAVFMDDVANGLPDSDDADDQILTDLLRVNYEACAAAIRAKAKESDDE